MRCPHVQITLSPSPRLSKFLGKVFFLKQLKRSICSMRYALNQVSHCNWRAACFMPRCIGLLNDSPISQPNCANKDDWYGLFGFQSSLVQVAKNLSSTIACRKFSFCIVSGVFFVRRLLGCLVFHFFRGYYCSPFWLSRLILLGSVSAWLFHFIGFWHRMQTVIPTSVWWNTSCRILFTFDC